MKYRDENGIFQDLYLPPTGDTLPIGAEVDYDGEEVPYGWEEVEEPKEIYSADEVKTNKVYIDENNVEHDVYRKIIRGTKGNDDLDLGIVSNDLTRVTETKGMLIDISNDKKPFPYFYSTNIWLSYEVNPSKKLIVYGATSQYSKGAIEVTVEYTKD